MTFPCTAAALLPALRALLPPALALLAVIDCTPSAAQTTTIQGIVTDALSGQPLEGASVAVEGADGATRGDFTDRNGFYLIDRLQPGTHTVRITYIAHADHAQTVTLAPGEDVRLSVQLTPTAIEVQGVTSGAAGGAIQRELGRQRITPAQISRLPTPAASGDLANYIQTLPGVVTAGDRGGQLFIRGGSHTENLSMIDGLLIYQPFHIVGFFSAFPEDLVANVDFYAGGFGARYNSRTSSVLDVRMRDGKRDGYAGSGSVSPFVADVVAEGKLNDAGSASFIIAGRKSLLEQTSPALMGGEHPLGFESQYAKITAFGEGSSTRCSAMALRTSDYGRLDVEDEISRVGWSNLVAGARCIQLFDGILRLVEMNVGYSGVDNDAVNRGASPMFSHTRRLQADVNTTNLYRGVTFEAGYFLRLEEMSYDMGAVYGFRHENDYLWTAGGYLETAMPLGEKVLVQPGVSVTLTQPRGLEPRLRASWKPRGNDDQVLSGAVGLYRQPLTGVSDLRDASSVFVAWARVPELEATRSLHAQVGWQQTFSSGLSWSLEGYLRRMRDVAVPSWSTVAKFNSDLVLADGEAYGMDARVEYARGPAYGFIGYGLSWTEYESAQDHFSLWFGEPIQRYNPPHDRRHQVNALASYELGPYTLSTRWQLGTGLPFTRPMGYDEAFDFRFNIQDVARGRGITRLLVDRPYQGRLPVMHRLDVSVEREFDLPFGTMRASAGAINLYDRLNMFYYDIYTHRRVDQLPLAPYASLQLEVR